MRKIATLPYNPPPGTRITEQSLTLPLPSDCCPRSKNPLEGSIITLHYTPVSCVLEVGSIYAYLASYRGGLKDDNGEIIVRDMEGMILRIVRDCGQALQSNVKARAEIQLRPFERMIIDAHYNKYEDWSKTI